MKFCIDGGMTCFQSIQKSYQHNFVCKFFSLMAIAIGEAPPGKMNYYYALVAAINDMESHGKSSDSTASSEAIDA